MAAGVTVERSIDEDRAKAVILGFAGTTDPTTWLTRETEVPVIDVAAAVKFIEGLVGIGVATSMVGATRWTHSGVARAGSRR